MRSWSSTESVSSRLRARVRSADVVYVKSVLEASEGLGAVFAEPKRAHPDALHDGGSIVIAGPRSRSQELEETIRDLREELDAIELQPPLGPGQRTTLDFDVAVVRRGAVAGNADRGIVRHGTFLFSAGHSSIRRKPSRRMLSARMGSKMLFAGSTSSCANS